MLKVVVRKKRNKAQNKTLEIEKEMRCDKLKERKVFWMERKKMSKRGEGGKKKF